MPNRYRWYRIQLPSKALDFIEIIESFPLTKDANFGFSRVKGSIGPSIFRFLWRTKIIVTQFDDNGTPSYQEVANVSFTDFAKIDVDRKTFLRIENPGRNIRDLLNALESLFGLGFTCKLMTFEKSKPTTVLENIETVKLIGLKVVGAVIDEDLVARIEFASKQGFVIEQMKLLEGLHYKVDTATYELIYEGIRGQLAVFSNGTIRVSGQLAPRLVELIEQDLASQV
jgi:hypothetical protein